MAGWADALGAILPAFITVGGGLISQNQLVQQAQGQANDARALAEKQYETALAQQKAQELASINANKNKVVTPPKNNTLLYVGLGVGGVVLIGVVIFAVTRN
jgi:hypothetical protein